MLAHIRKLDDCFGDFLVVKNAIRAAKAVGASFEDFEKEVVWHCYKEYKAPGMQQEHIAKQVSRAKRMWG